jgi:hypothetical protein
MISQPQKLDIHQPRAFAPLVVTVKIMPVVASGMPHRHQHSVLARNQALRQPLRKLIVVCCPEDDKHWRPGGIPAAGGMLLSGE